MTTGMKFYLSKLELIFQNAFVIEILIFTNVRQDHRESCLERKSQGKIKIRIILKWKTLRS
jgi:hypothetical protein